MEKHGQTVCLNMIVKNEAPVIRRCLDSLMALIDHWVIVDTGSTDGTQEIIREHLNHLPGTLIERPWVHFAHNRSEALVEARGKADWVLIIDADEVLVLADDFTLPPLEHHAYHFEILSGGVSYFKTQLVDNRLEWCFKNVIHEYIYSAEAETDAVLPGVRTLRFPDGARARDAHTYRRDALILENALIEEPDNSRYVFYLAQSYRDAGEHELSIRHYRRRVEMGGWIEEVWYSLYQIAEIQQRMGAPWAEVMQSYLLTYQTKPDRAEPLYKLGIHHQGRREFHLAYLFFRQAMAIPYPVQDRLFIEKPVYDHLLPIEYAVASYYVGDHRAAIETNNRLLCDPELPAEVYERVLENRRYSLDALCPKVAEPREEQAPVKVCVPFHDPGHWLDDCIESLLLQEHESFEVVLVDDASTADLAAKIPQDPRFRLLRHEERRGWAECVRTCVEEACGEEDIVLTFEGRDHLADREALLRLSTLFQEYGCQVMYGQHRYSSGHMGCALPLSGPASLEALRAETRCFSPLAFRAPLFRQVAQDEALPTVVGPDLEEGEQAFNVALLQAALLQDKDTARVRFNEHPLTVIALEAREPQAATETSTPSTAPVAP